MKLSEDQPFILSEIKRLVMEVDPNARVILYGSRARGDQREDSDWDLLIMTKGKADLELERRFRHKLFELEVQFGLSISTLAVSETDWKGKYSVTPLHKSISEEGVLL